MKNYLVTEEQFKNSLETIEIEKEMSMKDAMRKIYSTLSEKGYEDEQVVDFMIALRLKDPLTKELSKEYELDPEFKKAVKRLTLSVDI